MHVYAGGMFIAAFKGNFLFKATIYKCASAQGDAKCCSKCSLTMSVIFNFKYLPVEQRCYSVCFYHRGIRFYQCPNITNNWIFFLDSRHWLTCLINTGTVDCERNCSLVWKKNGTLPNPKHLKYSLRDNLLSIFLHLFQYQI